MNLASSAPASAAPANAGKPLCLMQEQPQKSTEELIPRRGARTTGILRPASRIGGERRRGQVGGEKLRGEERGGEGLGRQELDREQARDAGLGGDHPGDEEPGGEGPCGVSPREFTPM
jgi:hypothetical protein